MDSTTVYDSVGSLFLIKAQRHAFFTPTGYPVSLKGKSLYVMTPMYGGNLTLNYHNSFLQLVLLCRDLGVEIGWNNVWNESLISRARNRLADNYLKQGFDSRGNPYTHGVFIDADIGFDQKDVLAMLETDLDILGAGCVKKEIRWDRIQKALKRNGREYSNEDLKRVGGSFVANYLPGTVNIDLSKPQEVKHLGTGLLMIKREVFLRFREAYADRWYEPRMDPAVLPGPVHDFFKCGVNPESREYDSEDYWFCHDARAMGFKVWLCPWMKTTHMGTYEYVGDMPAASALAGDLT